MANGLPGEAAAKISCWSCHRPVDREDSYCRHCGSGLGSHVPWYYTHWGIVISMLLSGPLALYCVWRSPIVSRKAKWIYAVALALATIYFFMALGSAISTGIKAVTDPASLALG